MRKTSARGASSVSSHAALARKSWRPLPAIAVLEGNSDFFKEQIIRRFTDELFGEETREVRRYQGPGSERDLSELPLSTVLDELRTPSFFSARRLVVVGRGKAFLAAHRDVLEPYVEQGFGTGHLIVTVDGKAGMQTRFVKAVAATGWLVACTQPYDRPPPWETRTPIWESELSHWLVRRAADKGLNLDRRTAFTLHDRVGTDLAVLDEELEKIATFLAAEGESDDKGRRTVTAETVRVLTGELREDSIFTLVDLILEARRAEAVDSVARLFERGYHNESGVLVLDPSGIALPFIAALVNRLRSLRRGHAVTSGGGTSDDLVRERLVQKPFLPRFLRQLRATPPARIRKLFDHLYELDRSIKRGGDARRLMALLAAE